MGGDHTHLSLFFLSDRGAWHATIHGESGDLEPEEQQTSLSLTRTGGCAALAQWVSALATS